MIGTAPVPLKDTSLVGAFEALEATRKVAVLAPAAVGAKRTETVRVALGASVKAPPPLVMANSPALVPTRLVPVTFSGAPPVFFTRKSLVVVVFAGTVP